jgi:hypothetical protein
MSKGRGVRVIELESAKLVRWSGLAKKRGGETATLKIEGNCGVLSLSLTVTRHQT